MTPGEQQALADLAQQTRDLADSFLEHGYVEVPDFLRALASVVDGDCPVHGRGHSLAADLGRQSIEAHQRQLRGEPNPPLSPEAEAELRAAFPIDGRGVDREPVGRVIPRDVADRYGRDFIEQLNRPGTTDSEEH